jgi:HEAT repeat protein
VLILILIVVLSIINLLMLIFLLIRKALNIYREKKYREYEKAMLAEIEYSMMNDPPALFISKFATKKNRNFIYRLLLTLAAEKGENYHNIFDQAGYTEEKLQKLSKTNDLQIIKDLSIIRSPLAYNTLFELLDSPSSDITYRAAYALANIELDATQQKEIIETLLHTNIVIDRVIEIIEIINPPSEDYFGLLKQQRSTRGKVILLHFLKNKLKNKDSTYRYLQKKIQIESQKIIEQVLPFIYDEDEVANAAVMVLGETNDIDALEVILEKYRITHSDSIKITIAKQLHHFLPQKVIPYLRKMINEESWWVKFHAFESLIKLGKEGYNEVLAISMNAEDPVHADLAYQMISTTPNPPKRTFRMVKQPYGKDDDSQG